ncbi:hypothetical protein Ppa06_28950 [Planomonospora parontospora subsp. parontospora]|uniref:Lipoprotein n=3 Tax=Planomonospora parontospora TaxID=58119 RepID=A0AA37BH69_9ACTN|nr:hypothetical protein GCM10010126_29210 [Planomonospora parontospora]GII09097.1 hypothetical protein Ppa06_28950 [Planomonospora parontospora subsp. parontospora]
MPVAALALAALTGCAAGPGAGAAPAGSATVQAPPSPTRDVRRQIETERAACMKRKGFRYEIHVPAPRKVGDDERRAGSGDYEAMKRVRQKYGFKIFAKFVYPGDPAAERYFVLPHGTNDGIKQSLSETQAVAWEEADNDCRTEVVRKVLGKTVTTMEDYYSQLNRRLEQADRETNSDPRLIGLAQDFADCLKGKGYPVSSARPTDMREAGARAMEKEANRIGRSQAENPVDEVGGMEATYEPELTVEQARPYLAREIKAALDDLECGRDFYPAFFAGDAAKKAYQEFGHEAIQW